MDIQEQIQKLERDIAELRKLSGMPDHFHNGNDTSRIQFNDIARKTFLVTHSIPYNESSTLAYYNNGFWICPVACTVSSIREVHTQANGSALTLNIEHLTGTTEPRIGGAPLLLSTAFDLNAAANTVQKGALVNTASIRSFKIGDRLGLKPSTSPTSVQNVTIVLEMIIV